MVYSLSEFWDDHLILTYTCMQCINVMFLYGLHDSTMKLMQIYCYEMTFVNCLYIYYFLGIICCQNETDINVK